MKSPKLKKINNSEFSENRKQVVIVKKTKSSRNYSKKPVGLTSKDDLSITIESENF